MSQDNNRAGRPGPAKADSFSNTPSGEGRTDHPDAGSEGTVNEAMTNTGQPTGQGYIAGGAQKYASPGTATDRGYGNVGNTEYGTGADMPGSGSDDMQSMADAISQGPSALGADAGRGSDTGVGGDTGTEFGLDGARGVGTTGQGGPTSINASDRGSLTGIGSDTGMGSDTGLGGKTGDSATVRGAQIGTGTSDMGLAGGDAETNLGTTGGGPEGYSSEGTGSGMGTSQAR